MFGGLLAFLGIYAGSAAKAAYDNHEMKNYTRTVDKDGNVHYMDRLCNDYINGERVKKVETTDRNGVKLYSTVGVNSSRVYDTSYGRGTEQLFAMSEHDKQDAIERGKLAYMQYNPYFGRSVTTEIATGRTISVLSARINSAIEKRSKEITESTLLKKNIISCRLLELVIRIYQAIRKY